MSKPIFQLNDDQRYQINWYIDLYNRFNGGVNGYRGMKKTFEEQREIVAEHLSDDMIFLRWNNKGHMMGWKRMGLETDIPVDMIRDLRNTKAYKKALVERLTVVGIDMIDGVSMKKGVQPEYYISNKFGVNPIDSMIILNEIEPRDFFISRNKKYEENINEEVKFNRLVVKTQRYLQHSIGFKDSEEVSKKTIQWLIDKGLDLNSILSAKAAGMIFALERHQPCGRCLVPIYAERIYSEKRDTE